MDIGRPKKSIELNILLSGRVWENNREGYFTILYTRDRAYQKRVFVLLGC